MNQIKDTMNEFKDLKNLQIGDKVLIVSTNTALTPK